jgi:hypothetical protein
MKLAFAFSLLALGVHACSARQLPPGTPPPEYEPPVVTPWSGDPSDAGAAKGGDAVAPPDAVDAGKRPGSELSPDAGVR